MRALGDRVFADWVWGSFALYAGWLLLVVVACLVYAGVGNIADALVSEELRFATRLSLLTATISTLLSLLIGIPSASTPNTTNATQTGMWQATLSDAMHWASSMT